MRHLTSSTRRGATTLGLLLIASLTLIPALAGAEAGFEYRTNTTVQTDAGLPSLVLRATGKIKSGTVSYKRSDGKSFSQKLGAMKEDQEKTIKFQQPAGTFTYQVRVEALGGDGEQIEDSFELEATLAEPLKLTVDMEKTEPGHGTAALRSNRPLESIEVEIFDSDGTKTHADKLAMNARKGEFEVTWPVREDVAGVRLTAFDVDGFWQSVILEPFWVEIPHKEIIFDFGKSTWQPEEEPKLVDTLQSIHDAMAKYKAKGLQMQLYVAGYTDTVGSAQDNQRLSEQRARAIAHWFQKKGLKIPVFYQGFGESVLAVSTPDDTPEARNRRAVYVLGNGRPPISQTLPQASWKAVR